MNLFIPMLVSGLLTSFHCVMMCGNMVLSYAIKDDAEGSLLRRMTPHFAYHGAKIISYTAVGLLLGSIGSFISAEARSWVSVAAGGYMVLLGLSMTGRFPALRRIEPRPPRFFMTLLSRMRRKAAEDDSAGESNLATPASFGLLTGFMPCGPLIAAQVAAAGSGSTLTGGSMMLAFGLGTAPLMLGYGAVASYLGKQFKQYMSVAAAVVIVVLGIVMVNRGATALGSPVNFDVAKKAIVGTAPVEVDESQFKVGADGIVEVPLGLKGFTFTPSTLVVPVDKPVRIVVNRQDANLCSDELWIPSLGVKAPLTPNGQTVIDLPATKAGTYQMTCQMGMLSATLQVGSAAGSSSRGLILAALAALALGGTAVVHKRALEKKAEAERQAARARAASKRHGKHKNESHKKSGSRKRKHK